MTRWPNLFVVGAARAGTTSFYHCLKQHPEIYMSRLKEPHYLAPSNLWPRRRLPVGIASDEDYLRLFRRASGEKLIGEASTSYLVDPEAAGVIHRVSPEARIVILLREPVERAYSHYLFELGEGYERRSFLDALREPSPAMSRYARPGLYCAQVRRYLDRFGAAVLVLFFEEAFRDLRAALRNTFEFLEIEPSVADRIRLRRHNVYPRPRNLVTGSLIHAARAARSTAGRPLAPGRLRPYFHFLAYTSGDKPPLDPEARRILVDLYAAQRECLRELLGVDPPWEIEPEAEGTASAPDGTRC